MEHGLEKQTIARIYSFYSFFYNWTFGLILSPRIKATFQVTPFQKGERILEVGIGTGLSLKYYPKEVKVTGIDISFAMLKRASAINHHNIFLVQMDALNLAFKDSYFDRIICAFVVSTLPDVKKAMEEMWRVIKPSGEVVVINHFTSKNSFIKTLEKIIDPLTRKLGWISDFPEETITSLNLFKVKKVFKKSTFSPWKTFFLKPVK